MYPSSEPATKWLICGAFIKAIGEYIMTFNVYILQSQTSGRFYCGQTKNLEQRIRHHNDPDYRPDATTRRFKGPWLLVWKELHDDRSAAMSRERKIKRQGIQRFLNRSSVG
jgi:putative endonuclease